MAHEGLQNSDKRAKAFAVMAAIRGKNVESFVKNLTDVDAQRFKAAEPELAGFAGDALRKKFAALFAEEELAMLADIHPSWLLESLSQESPKVIGLILRFLPSKHVRYILEHLPKRTKLLLPKLVDSFAVPTPLLNIVRRRFEEGFIVTERALLGKHPVFQRLVKISASEFDIFFEDLGLHEMAIAFQKMSGLKMLLNRLSVTRARALQRRIKEVAEVDARLVKEARYAILSINSPELNEADMLHELGIFAFASSFGKDDESLYNIFKLKLEPKLSYLLKRYIRRALKTNPPAVTRGRQTICTERLEKLIRAGAIVEPMVEEGR